LEMRAAATAAILNVPIHQPCEYIQIRVSLYSAGVFAGIAEHVDRHVTCMSKDHEQHSYHYVRA
jgi:hypothetical protein